MSAKLLTILQTSVILYLHVAHQTGNGDFFVVDGPKEDVVTCPFLEVLVELVE